MVLTQTRARLIRLWDHGIMFEERVFCTSDQMSFREWGEGGGRWIESALEACIPRIAEKIISESSVDDILRRLQAAWSPVVLLREGLH